MALELPPAVNSQRKVFTQLRQAGSASLGHRHAPEESPRTKRLAMALELTAVALTSPRFHTAATAVVTELATRLGCDRVSMGFLQDGHLKLQAFSHNAGFSPKQQLIRQLAAAMEQALEREATVLHPSPEGKNPAMCFAHTQLARQQPGSSILTVLLHHHQTLLGAITFERGAGRPPFDAETVTLCEQIAALIGPILDLRRREERPLPAVIGEVVRTQLAHLFGPGYLVAKLATVVVIAHLVMAAVLPGQYQVTADALLEGRVERVVAVPQKGFIQSVSVRPGDAVEEGVVLATLDDRDLSLDQIKWSAKHEQVAKEYRKALAERDRANIGILRAQLDQAEAQLSLIKKQLARLQIIAPFAGVVVSGDFTQALGSPVERGQVLFRIAPLGGYRVILKVEEGDIADVREGQRGRLTLTAAPGETLPIRIEKITPVATADAVANYFRVEAQLDNPPKFLRPGMQGVAKVDIESRRLLWIWTRSLLNWARVKAWAWLP